MFLSNLTFYQQVFDVLLNFYNIVRVMVLICSQFNKFSNFAFSKVFENPKNYIDF